MPKRSQMQNVSAQVSLRELRRLIWADTYCICIKPHFYRVLLINESVGVRISALGSRQYICSLIIKKHYTERDNKKTHFALYIRFLLYLRKTLFYWKILLLNLNSNKGLNKLSIYSVMFQLKPSYNYCPFENISNAKFIKQNEILKHHQHFLEALIWN